MKRLLYFVLFYLFCYVLAFPQEYIITETQLQKLETICQTYKASNQKLTEQLNESMQDSNLLKTQLQTERALTKSLNESLTKYEISASESEAEKINLTLELQEQKTKYQKLMKWFVVSICASVLLLAGAVVLIILLVKKP